MAAEEILRRKRSYLGSFLGVFLSWIGILVITAGVALALRELHIYHATRATLINWGQIFLGVTAGIYAVVMFAISWSFTRFLGIQFALAAAFAIWSMIPICNIIPLLLLLFIASSQVGKSENVSA